MYDVATLVDFIDNFEDIRKSYMRTVLSEIQYRGIATNEEDVLRDTLESAASIASRCQYGKDYGKYLRGNSKYSKLSERV